MTNTTNPTNATDTEQPRTKTLEQLDGTTWPDPGKESTGLMRTVHAARRIPVGDLDAAQLRALLRQHIGVPHIVPRALELVTAEPMLDAGYYPGDLLAALVDLGDEYWARNPEHAVAINDVRHNAGR